MASWVNDYCIVGDLLEELHFSDHQSLTKFLVSVPVRKADYYKPAYATIKGKRYTFSIINFQPCRFISVQK